MSEVFRLKVKTHFDAAHYIRDYAGKCSREHGHRWEIEAVFEGAILDARNILLDFGEIKLALHEVIDECLDHYRLNDTLEEPNVTAEFLSKYLFNRVYDILRYSHTPPIKHGLLDAVERGVKLLSVCIWESPECCVKYYKKEERRTQTQ